MELLVPGWSGERKKTGVYLELGIFFEVWSVQKELKLRERVNFWRGLQLGLM